MILLLAFAFVIGALLGCFGMNTAAVLFIALIATAGFAGIAAAQVAHLGIAFLGAIAENIGLPLIGIIVSLEIGYLCGLVLLYGTPRSLRQVRTLLHH